MYAQVLILMYVFAYMHRCDGVDIHTCANLCVHNVNTSAYIHMMYIIHSCICTNASLQSYTDMYILHTYNIHMYTNKSKSTNRHGSHTAAKSEIAVTYIPIILYYSTLVQTNVSLLQSFHETCIYYVHIMYI